LQCGPANDSAWDKAEEETELAKQEACNVKVQTSKTTETAEIAASKKREVFWPALPIPILLRRLLISPVTSDALCFAGQ